MMWIRRLYNNFYRWLMGYSYERRFSIIPSDTEDLSQTAHALYVSVGGDLRIKMLGNEDITLKDVASGSMLPIKVRRVYRTGTSAVDIMAFALGKESGAIEHLFDCRGDDLRG